MTQRNLNRLSNLMLWLNFAAILSIATQILFISQYINQNQLSYQFLTRLKRIPASPTSIFWQCTVFSLALIFLITIRHQYHFSKKTNNLFVILEFIAAVCTFYAVRMNYNGMFLLVFVDFFMTTPDISSNAYYRFTIFCFKLFNNWQCVQNAGSDNIHFIYSNQNSLFPSLIK